MTLDDLFGDSRAASDLDRNAAAVATLSVEPLAVSRRALARHSDIPA